MAARADLKADIPKRPDGQKAQLNSYRGNLSISRLRWTFFSRPDRSPPPGPGTTSRGKAGHTRPATSAAHRHPQPDQHPLEAPAPLTCPPTTWQQLPSEERRQDLQRWIRCLTPFWDALSLMLQLLYESGAPHKVVAGRPVPAKPALEPHLPAAACLELDPQQRIVPEISGHRLMVAIRLMRQDSEGRLRQGHRRPQFSNSRCAPDPPVPTPSMSSEFQERTVTCPACQSPSLYSPANLPAVCCARCRGASTSAPGQPSPTGSSQAQRPRTRARPGPRRAARSRQSSPFTPPSSRASWHEHASTRRATHASARAPAWFSPSLKRAKGSARVSH